LTQIGSVTLGANDLTVTAGDVDSQGTMTGSGSVVLSPSPATATIGIGGRVVRSTSNDPELALFADGFAGLRSAIWRLAAARWRWIVRCFSIL
jgi:hypothetical protein